MIHNEKLDLCTGCGACASVCPAKCIHISLDANGFYKPIVDAEVCTQCNLCNRVCTIEDSCEEKEVLQAFSAYAQDENTLATTSSGGICYEISKWGLKNGYKVCGVVYNYQKHRAEHAIITNLEQLEETKGSKYFQSYTPVAFSEIFNAEQWIVIGTPCQIAAIDKVARIKKIRERLILIDFFCHGVPSMHVWKHYLKELDEKNITKIGFRSKEFGWRTFSLSFEYSDGTETSDYSGNLFYKMFFSNCCLNNSCYQCHYKATKSHADIRVGDFWGKKYEENKKGLSSMLIFTEQGQEIVAKLKEICVFVSESVADALEGQMFVSPQKPKVRSRLLKGLRNEKTLDYLYKVTLFPFRLQSVIKSKLRGR
ncbi:MAG: 4Fe-4S dicluster domain-containing protein [Ruminococcaceae bacterium]|nr:4Fe-4S dicluster domain-containing protein [Oscillospiraceae bacterium]